MPILTEKNVAASDIFDMRMASLRSRVYSSFRGAVVSRPSAPPGPSASASQRLTPASPRACRMCWDSEAHSGSSARVRYTLGTNRRPWLTKGQVAFQYHDGRGVLKHGVGCPDLLNMLDDELVCRAHLCARRALVTDRRRGSGAAQGAPLVTSASPPSTCAQWRRRRKGG